MIFYIFFYRFLIAFDEIKSIMSYNEIRRALMKPSKDALEFHSSGRKGKIEVISTKTL